MRNLIVTATVILSLTLPGCTTVSTKQNPVVKVEFTAKQNWINLGTTLIGAGLQGLLYYGASKKMAEDLQGTLREQRQAIPMPVVTIPVGWP